jgi:hypothetical protein
VITMIIGFFGRFNFIVEDINSLSEKYKAIRPILESTELQDVFIQLHFIYEDMSYSIDDLLDCECNPYCRADFPVCFPTDAIVLHSVLSTTHVP